MVLFKKKKEKEEAMVVGFRFWGKLQTQTTVHKMRARDRRNVIFGVVDMAKQCKRSVFGRGDNVDTYIYPFSHVILCIRQFFLAKNVTCHHVSGLEHLKR